MTLILFIRLSETIHTAETRIVPNCYHIQEVFSGTAIKFYLDDDREETWRKDNIIKIEVIP